ncbi:pilus assembly protein TadG-related protein [Mesorhizobium sp. A623]
MLSNRSKFLASESGSLVPIFALSLLPLLLAVGLSVDYTSATTTKADMQSALDAASLSIVTMPKDASRADRQTALQAAFLGNGGNGAAALNAFSIGADGTVNLQASATYAMPTNFMQLAMIKAVPVGVQTSVNKTPALVEATFKIDLASGWWSKKIYLYGVKFGETKAQKLLEIDYTYKQYNYTYKYGGKSETISEPKGYGTTVVNKITTVSGKEKLEPIQSQTCDTKVSDTNNAPAGVITNDAQRKDGKKIYFQTTCPPPSNEGAVIDVSQMNSLYLQMDVYKTNGLQPTNKLKSDDPETSDHLYIGNPDIQDGKMLQVEQKKVVDIFTAVPCGKTSKQAWEDGGSDDDMAEHADFSYFVTGKCDFNKRPSETVLTQ